MLVTQTSIDDDFGSFYFPSPKKLVSLRNLVPLLCNECLEKYWKYSLKVEKSEQQAIHSAGEDDAKDAHNG